MRVALVVLAVAAVAVAVRRHAGGALRHVPTGPEVAGGPAVHTDEDYWTEERMRGARPAPMPGPSEDT